MSKTPMVTARKDKKVKQFSLKNWEDMPKDKYGWELISTDGLPTPKEVIEAPEETKKVSIVKDEQETESPLPPKKRAKK
jgi:hypothetical protein